MKSLGPPVIHKHAFYRVCSPRAANRALRQAVTGECPLIIDGTLEPVCGEDQDGERVTYQQAAEVPGRGPRHENCYAKDKSECKEKMLNSKLVTTHHWPRFPVTECSFLRWLIVLFTDPVDWHIAKFSCNILAPHTQKERERQTQKLDLVSDLTK